MGQKAGYCSRCGKKIVGASHKIKDASYCGGCYQIEMQSLADAEKGKKELYAYIRDLFGKSVCPEPVVLAIERALASGKTLTGIKFTIYYYYQVLANTAENINEVPWTIRDYYDEARDYAVSMKKLGEENKKVEINNIPSEIKIKKPTRHVRLRRKLITLED